MKIGYARVSTKDQKLDLQIDALKRAGCEKIFSDVISGASTERPNLDAMLAQCRAGDTVVIYKLDRLGRTSSESGQSVHVRRNSFAEFNRQYRHFYFTREIDVQCFRVIGGV